MKKIFTFFLIFFTAAAVYANQPQWGLVDAAALINLHPLMQQFDPQTRRFHDTLSQPLPSEDPGEFIARLQNRLQSMENTIRSLDANYADKISGSGMAARKSYALYWKKRESLRFYAELLREAINLAAKQGNFYLNMPSDWTLMPVTRGISSTVNEVCAYLKKKHELQGILDVSVFKAPTDSGAALGTFNQHWALWRGDEKALSQTDMICRQIMYSIRGSFPEQAHRPVVAGAIDLQPVAVRMLRNIALPTSDIPDSED